jgi:hypothetical protein
MHSFAEKVPEGDKQILKGKLVEVIGHVESFRELGTATSVPVTSGTCPSSKGGFNPGLHTLPDTLLTGFTPFQHQDGIGKKTAKRSWLVCIETVSVKGTEHHDSSWDRILVYIHQTASGELLPFPIPI